MKDAIFVENLIIKFKGGILVIDSSVMNNLKIKLDKRIWINIYEIKEVIKKEKDLVLILSNNEIITILKGYNKNIRKINDTKKVFSYIEKI